MIPLSFEFYPLKTDEQRAQLDRTAKKLKAHSPEYVSCTFGAGGSTLDHTPETIDRSEEHTSELQSLMRNSYAVFYLKKKIQRGTHIPPAQHDTQHSPTTIQNTTSLHE